ncbi:hypothetical protein [Enterovibrio nigricans]|uniref:Uncharacterized protein n=1 Tax=Enterovibrio nigricans DSM 22720 TaxID=1121868 RepID=A0A1T4VAP8_9GAMM|nr:hypothetical protein [Enterovibrio nigricans]PKF48895.1 hypothetical protein AT251_22810 [Enterovibrio nigricans]SKA62009.1 hypothetical protein SAMN02745132_03550 [Enterovibrio nigricans DSM 22720]
MLRQQFHHLPASVTGTVSAPSGTVVNFSKPTLLEHIFPPAYAAIVGLEPVRNATVELIRVDDDGKQIGDVIASAPTSITGEYRLNLPSGLSLAGNLVVRVRGQNTDMNAIAINQKVDVDPGSHYIYKNLIDSDLVMADLAENHIVTLRGVIDELDLTAGTDLTETLAALDAVAGFQLKQEIGVLTKTPGDASQFAGAWHGAIFEMSLHDEDTGTSGSFYTSIEGSEFNVEAVSNDTLSITDSYEENFGILHFYQGGAGIESSLFTATEIQNTPEDPEQLQVNITSDGSLIERVGLDEHLSYDNGNGPEFGFRTLPSTFILESAGSDDVKIGINQELGLRFLTVDTDNDGKFDALDPNQKVGDEPSLTMDLLVRKGIDISNNTLSGNIGVVIFDLILNSNNAEMEVVTESSILSFDGNGTFSTSDGSEKRAEILRTPTSLAFSDSPPEDSLTGTYNLSTDGLLTLTIDGDNIQGFISPTGDLLVASLIERFPEEAESITDYAQLLAMGIGLGDTPPSIAGSTYKLYPIELGFTQSGGTEVLTFSHPGTMTFDDAGTQATLQGETLGIIKNTVLGQSIAPTEDSETFTMSANVDVNSGVTLTENDGTFEGLCCLIRLEDMAA